MQAFYVFRVRIFPGTTIASSLMDKQGRKSLLLTSFAGMVLFVYLTIPEQNR